MQISCWNMLNQENSSSDHLNMRLYIYIYLCVCMYIIIYIYVCIYIYMYISLSLCNRSNLESLAFSTTSQAQLAQVAALALTCRCQRPGPRRSAPCSPSGSWCPHRTRGPRRCCCWCENRRPSFPSNLLEKNSNWSYWSLKKRWWILSWGISHILYIYIL